MPEIGKELFISNSQIQEFKDCERRWYIKYYRELAPRRSDIVGPLQLGTKIHKVLEIVYTDLDNDPMELLNQLYVEDFEKLQEAQYPEEAIKALTKEKELAVAMVEGFLEWREEEGLDAGYDVLSNEEVLLYPLPDYPGVSLRGKLDQRVRRQVDGAIFFNDWKTTVSFTDRLLLVLNEQMKFYMLLEYLTKEPSQLSDGARYTMLRKVKRTAAAKPPFYNREEVRHNKETIQNFYLSTIQMVERIIKARKDLDDGLPMQYVVPPRPSRDCSWKCPFTAICPLFDDGSNVELAMQEHLVHQDPDARYQDEGTKEIG